MSHAPDVWRGVKVNADWVIDRIRGRRKIIRARANKRDEDWDGILRENFMGTSRF